MSRSGYLVLEHAIDEIELGFSFRRDLGDLDELVESIRRTGGLLVPISITPQNVLIAGERRLAALRILEYRVAPVWVVTGVSDKLATVLAIKDEHALQKLLTPVEQAELYTEYKEILAEDNARKQRATRFGAGSAAAQTEPDEADPDPAAAPIEPGGHGGVESTPPHTEPAGALGKTRVQAAKAVTGRDSHSMLDQVVELQQIAAAETEDPEIRQQAAEALIELNTDGKVNGRYLRVKILQALAALRRAADDPAEPEPVRQAASAELQVAEAQEAPKDMLREATRALAHLAQVRQQAAAAEEMWQSARGPIPEERRLWQERRSRRPPYHYQRDRFDADDFGRYADPDQWELVASYAVGSSRFLEAATLARNAALQDSADALV